MRYRHILSEFYSTPLAILPSKLAAIRDFLELKAAGGDVSADEVRAVVWARANRQEVLNAAARKGGEGVMRAGRVGVVPLMGAISQRVGMIEEASGGVGCDAVASQLDTLAADKSCKAICLWVDSPGGSVYGVSELAAKIRAICQEKKCVAMVDSVAASAAYWLASQCSEINVTPGGQVGSIGVIAAHEDQSKAADNDGVKTTLVTSSKYKGEGNPYGPLDDDAKAELQSKVNAYHAMFVSAVAKGRGVTEARVEKDFGQGRMALAADAVKAGMADRVATFAQVLSRLGAGEASGATAAASEVPLSSRLAAARARAVEVESGAL